jgi:hypothetical protein
MTGDTAEAAKKADRTAREEVLANFKVGDKVRVTARRGRGAPPLGTEGKIIWEGHSQEFGTPRVGILDALGEKHWTSRGNVTRVLTNPPADGGWVAFRRAEKEAEEKAERIERDRREELEGEAARKGEWVRLTSDHKTFGKVFWRGWKGDRLRIGFKVKKCGEPTWCGVEEVEVLSGNPSRKTRTTTVVRPSLDKEWAVEHPVDPSRVVDFPAPFCDIRKLRIADLGWVALSADGVVIATLPEDQAIALIG